MPTTAHAAHAADRCPRCGVAFRCGAEGPGPCPCTTVDLSAALQARLRQQFSGCLCLACLQALARDEPAPGNTAPAQGGHALQRLKGD